MNLIINPQGAYLLKCKTPFRRDSLQDFIFHRLVPSRVPVSFLLPIALVVGTFVFLGRHVLLLAAFSVVD